MKYKRGKYRIKNPKKYKGNFNNIVYRSGLELRYFRYFDESDNILEWSSEEVVVPYLHPRDNKIHRYFVDNWVKVRTKSGEIKEYLIEIKPKKFTKPPRKRKNMKSYNNEAMTYLVNDAKWKSAERYCNAQGMEFIILTEKDI